MKLAAVGVALLAAVALSWLFYQSRVANPRVVLELRQRPDGERASRVMLVTLPSGRTIPVNYRRWWALVHKSKCGDSYAASRSFSGTNRERFGSAEAHHAIEDVACHQRLGFL